MVVGFNNDSLLADFKYDFPRPFKELKFTIDKISF